MFHNNLKKVVEKNDLSVNEMTYSMDCLMENKVDDFKKSSFLTAMTMKGTSQKELYAAAKVMREKTKDILSFENGLDTCGTGGDGKNTFNISTISAIITACADVNIVKHGNRSVSSKCGSADVLEALGANIDLKPKQVESCIKKIGFGFLFAPNFHPAMKNVMSTRKSLGFKTFFNQLGPLTNPAKADYQVIGVYDEKLVEKFANVLSLLGVKRALVVHGSGLDEISISGETKVSEVKNGKVKSYKIHPEIFGLKTYAEDSIIGGDVDKNKQIILDILNGKKGGPRDIVLLNSGAAIYLSGKANSIKEGVKIAREIIDSKKALNLLNRYVEYTRSF
ncbi:MAG: anthranilate phosphoribosyltransferase [Bacillota bacterium]